MHYSIEVVTLGDYADPRNVLALAIAAEKAGWLVKAQLTLVMLERGVLVFTSTSR